MQLPTPVRALCLSLFAMSALSTCEPVDGPARGPQPATSFTFDDDADPGIVKGRVDRRVTPPAPHRSGRAGLPHPAPHTG